MIRHWISDIHFAHANIAKYCKRPWLHADDLDEHGNWKSPETALQCAERMDTGMIKIINGRVKPDDTVIHVGDFMNYGKAKGVEGLRNKPKYYLDQLNGTWVMIKGNHDPNNHLKTIGNYLITDIGPYRVFVSHYPTDSFVHDPFFMKWVSVGCDFAIVGHVHEKWKECWLNDGKNRPIFNINVGVDVRKFITLTDSDIIVIYEKAMREKKRKENEKH